MSGVWGARKYAEKIGQIKVKGIPSGGNILSYGPSKSANFPFVVLGRALLHHQLISTRTHANRQVLDLTQPLLDKLSDKERRRIGKLFADIRNDRKVSERRAEIGEMILGWCSANHNDLNT